MKQLNQRGFSLVASLLIVLIIAVLGFAGYYVYNEQTKKNDKKEETATTSQTTTTAKEETKPSEKEPSVEIEAPELIEYDPVVGIQKKNDVEKLKDASQGFKDFIATYVGAQPETGDCPLTVTVRKIAKDEFAIGGISHCSGSRYVWKKTDGQWARIRSLGGQAEVNCTDVIDHRVPASIIERCYDMKMQTEISNPNQ